jgi:arsenate reductase
VAIVVHHNPDRGTSRNVLRFINASRVGDEQLPAAMVAHPVLVDRATACTPRGVRPCRPSDVVPDRLPAGPLCKGEGEPVIDEEGRRVV